MITASFSAGTLCAFGKGLANAIVVSRDAGGTVFINGGAVRVVGSTPAETAARDGTIETPTESVRNIGAGQSSRGGPFSDSPQVNFRASQPRDFP